MNVLSGIARPLTVAAWAYAAFTSQAVGAKPLPAFDACFDLHGRAYGVDPELLRAIARTESAMHPSAMNLRHAAATGSVDVGLMQINSRWLPTLAKHGISRAALDQPCTNIEVGAWILADLLRRKGNSWDAVGAWNAACTQLKGEACLRARAKFAWKVHRNLRRAHPEQHTPAPVVPPVALVRLSEISVPGSE